MKPPRSISRAICTFAALTLVGLSCAPAPKVGSAVKPFQAVDGSGRAMSEADLEGRVTVMYFWATWCAPCVTSSPAMQRIHERFAGNDRVGVLAVHYDRSPEAVDYVKRHGFTYPVIPDGTALVSAWSVKKVPATLVIDPAGQVVYSKVGFAPADEDSIVGVVSRALGD
jgi:peroxiredoxin